MANSGKSAYAGKIDPAHAAILRKAVARGTMKKHSHGAADQKHYGVAAHMDDDHHFQWHPQHKGGTKGQANAHANSEQPKKLKASIGEDGIVGSIINKNYNGVNEAIVEKLQDKIADRIQEAKKVIAKSMYEDALDPESTSGQISALRKNHPKLGVKTEPGDAMGPASMTNQNAAKVGADISRAMTAAGGGVKKVVKEDALQEGKKKKKLKMKKKTIDTRTDGEKWKAFKSFEKTLKKGGD